MANDERQRGKYVDEATGTETVGHEWDGIQELNTPLPRWWLWSFYLTIIWAIGYIIVYPAIPMLEKGTQGVLGWSSRGQLAQELSAEALARAPVEEAVAATSLAELPLNDELMQKAVAGGAAAFRVHCVQCHGANAAGSEGYPNLTDDEWLWGGNMADIETTLQHGIRQPGDSATRVSLMPAFGRDGILSSEQIDAVTNYVGSLTGNGTATPEGAELYANNCAVCHGADAGGLRQFGTPSLNDAVWLYGSSLAAIRSQIFEPRHGVMPAWEEKLEPATIRMLAAYVHSLGGGEEFVEVAAAPAEAGPDEQE